MELRTTTYQIRITEERKEARFRVKWVHRGSVATRDLSSEQDLSQCGQKPAHFRAPRRDCFAKRMRFWEHRRYVIKLSAEWGPAKKNHSGEKLRTRGPEKKFRPGGGSAKLGCFYLTVVQVLVRSTVQPSLIYRSNRYHRPVLRAIYHSCS